jgi:glutathione S-transferase
VRLHHHPASPYVRKVMVAAHELGLAGTIALLPTTPETVVADVGDDNPLGRIPTLVTEHGLRLYDSLVIADYLNERAGGTLFPPPGPGRWRALTRHALGQGIIDAAVQIFHEERRPAAQQSAGLLEGQRAEIERALDALERDPGDPGAGPTIGDIAVAVALAYLDRRCAGIAWRARRQRLSHWFETMAARPSFRATAFAAR